MFSFVNKDKKFLIFVFIFSLVINYLFFYFFLNPNNDYWRGDTPWYHEVAVQIAKGNGIKTEDGVSSYYRVPGYSLFLAFCYKFFDFEPKKALVIQIILSAFIPVLVFLVSLGLFPTNISIARISSLIFSLNLGNWLYSGFLMSETVFLFLFLLFFIFYLKCLKFLKFKYLILAGLFLGLASLVRPVGHFVVFLSFSILFFLKKSKKTILKRGLIFILSWFVVVSPWLIRNYILTKTFFFHAMTGDHFLTYLASDVKSIGEKKSFFIARRELLEQWRNSIKGKKLNYKQVSSIGEDISSKVFLKFPFITIKRCIFNCIKTICGFHTSIFLDKYSKNFVGYDTTVTLKNKILLYLLPKVENKFFIFFVYYEIFWLLFYIGVIGFLFLFLIKKELFFRTFILFSFIFLFIFLTLGIGLARLRYPIEPFMTMMATYFWNFILNKE